MTETIEWRCPRMIEHVAGRWPWPGVNLPHPCPDCYSVRVVSERIPYQAPAPRPTPSTPRKDFDEKYQEGARI